MERFFKVEREHYRIWRTIGTELSVDVYTLSAIEKHHADDKDRLHAVIDSANPVPTREAMTKILQSANIKNAIAGMIMCSPPPYPTLPLKLNLNAIAKVGWDLHTGNDDWGYIGSKKKCTYYSQCMVPHIFFGVKGWYQIKGIGSTNPQ